ncbi:endonuclease/exonuclease/phosphatase (EEP) superfamily protein YafD [Gillisia mitskevichiae]|uniref:Endonuclease/exonuclease/phosphatase (EEP) superfamily protein YafD n=1 Tax=Gillisia mitskevichiae TaxID=270921 RepID=A0A495PL32_9FLAO|nr:endonuclease/exonuclease/phosphatase family protein [Gillisia mitskevichiae]RKS50560.1 endonuclease/exonuclease/phosphatase (EEP) superfamily protein YafD [Gillisia mitskevichiae]
MGLTEIVVIVIGIIMLIPTLASITRFDHWWIRGFDFPRLQISFLLILEIIAFIIIFKFDELWEVILLFLLVFSLFYQFVRIFPYTPFAKKTVQSFRGDDVKDHISILVSNVLTTNTSYDKLIHLVNNKNPDLLLTLETDKKWESELEVIEVDYKYSVKIPMDNLYGMHLYSKLELENIHVKYLIDDEIPSIHGHVILPNGHQVKIHCLHPKPPSPTEDLTSTNRDAELLFVGRDVKKDQESVLVLGDLNDVAWSRTTRLFQKISGLMDPRLGRGFFNTFHTGFFFLRWPLDHVFHTNDFTLVSIARLKSIGSDHFPMYIKLNHEPRAEGFQDKPEKADSEEQEWAEEKINNGHPTETDV